MTTLNTVRFSKYIKNMFIERPCSIASVLIAKVVQALFCLLLTIVYIFGSQYPRICPRGLKAWTISIERPKEPKTDLHYLSSAHQNYFFNNTWDRRTRAWRTEMTTIIIYSAYQHHFLKLWMSDGQTDGQTRAWRSEMTTIIIFLPYQNNFFTYLDVGRTDRRTLNL